MGVGYPNPDRALPFWRDALEWPQAITRDLLPNILASGVYAALVLELYAKVRWGAVRTSHVEYTGGVLVLLLVLRSNASYDRWWEGRKLWGGIVNQTRNLAATAWAHAPEGGEGWAGQVARWTAAFPHACKQSLRSRGDMREVEKLLGADATRELERAQHIPLYVSEKLERLFAQGRAMGLDPWVVIALQRERGSLIDHLGGCERILKTPMPRLHTITLRRFMLVYLLGLPFAIAAEAGGLTPVITMLVGYPLLAIDLIAHHLERPFDDASLSHLPLEAICQTIDENLLALPLVHEPRATPQAR